MISDESSSRVLKVRRNTHGRGTRRGNRRHPLWPNSKLWLQARQQGKSGKCWAEAESERGSSKGAHLYNTSPVARVQSINIKVSGRSWARAWQESNSRAGEGRTNTRLVRSDFASVVHIRERWLRCRHPCQVRSRPESKSRTASATPACARRCGPLRLFLALSACGCCCC